MKITEIDPVPINVLIVEDTETNRQLFKGYLEEMGNTVMLAEDGLQAVEMVKNHKDEIDAIIMDVEMPNLNGYEATQAIRELMGEQWVPIIMLSVHHLEDDLAHGIDFGADDYLIKPISQKVLEKKILAMARIAHMRHLLEDSNKELAEKNELLENFAYLLTNDIKHPLRTIQSFADLLVKKCSGMLDDKGNSYVVRIRQTITNLNDLTTSLLAYTKLGNKTLHKSNVNIEVLIHEIEEDNLSYIEETQTEITCGELPEIMGDKMLLKQLFSNLIINSIRFQEIGNTPKISIDCECSDGQKTILVKDNGTGIEASEHEKIFGFLKRLHHHNQTEGNGIGLAICKKVADMHGATIKVESKIGHGTTMKVTFAR